MAFVLVKYSPQLFDDYDDIIARKSLEDGRRYSEAVTPKNAKTI